MIFDKPAGESFQRLTFNNAMQYGLEGGTPTIVWVFVMREAIGRCTHCTDK